MWLHVYVICACLVFLSVGDLFVTVHKQITNAQEHRRPDHDQQHCYHHAPTVKPEAAAAVVVAPDDGHEDARNMLNCI